MNLGRCHAVGCSDLASFKTLIGVRLCERHFSQFYSDEECPLEDALNVKLPANRAAYWRDIRRRASKLTDPEWLALAPRQLRWRCWLMWHHVWWPIQWHAPSIFGRLRGRHRCGHCDRFIVRELDIRGIWICDECRDRSYSKTGATFGGDAGKNQFCVRCQQPGESEVYGAVYCHPHGHEAFTGKPYIAPTDDEIRATRALLMAMQSLDDMNQGPPTVTTDRSSFSTLDGPYLKRLVELTEKFDRELEKPQ